MIFLKHILLTTLIVIGSAFSAMAQNADQPKVYARISADSISIGDHFTIDVEVEKDLVQVVDFPQYEGKISENVEVIKESEVDTIARDGRNITIRKRYTLTTFDEGIYNLGRFPVLYADKNIVDTLRSIDSLSIMVTTFAVDTTTQQIYDIKAPLKTPVMASEFLGYLLMAYLLLQIIFAVVFIIVKSRKQKNGKTVVRKNLIPPHIKAIQQLERLNREKLWQNNRHKLYYTRLTDIVREYIEERYSLGAMEMTSDEIFVCIDNIITDKRIKMQLSRLLTTSDYVKFAKYTPSVEDNEMSYNDAYYFVEETKVNIVEEEDKEDKGKEDQNEK